MAAISGDWDVEALKARLDPRQVDKWLAWDTRYPLGNDSLLGLIARLIIWTAASKGANLRLDELMPWTKPLEE